MNISVLAIDLAKNVFQLHGVDARGEPALRRQVKRAKLAEIVQNVPPCRVAMEACAGAHHWARRFRAMGHEVCLIAPQFVKPFVKSNKTDANDAEAIAEAASRPAMRFVPVKTLEQQDVQALHRVRSLLVKDRTALINQARGLLAEYGVVLPQSAGAARRGLPVVLEDAENGLTCVARELIEGLRERLVELDARIQALQRRIEALAEASEACRRLDAIPGIGLLIASALAAGMGDPRMFRNGREFAAWLGLVPRQRSSGGKARLGGISKRGDAYLRTLLVHGARAVVRTAEGKDDRLSRWVNHLHRAKGANLAAVALANKLARIAWALLARGKAYRAAA